MPGIPPPEVFEQARKNNPVWYQILEKAYQKFSSLPENEGIYPKVEGQGATLEQVWFVAALAGIKPVCLLAKPYPAAHRKRIQQVVELPAAEVVRVLADIQAAQGFIGATTMHYDGKTGHCIVVLSHDPETDRFTYHDPWPDKSLLCKENNLAGVDAQPEGKHWSVSAAELERVLFATFVMPAAWARHQGVEVDLLFDEWRRSEFFEFFRLVELDSRSEQDMHRHMFAPPAFKNEVTVIVDWRDGGKITRASLILDKGWMKRNVMLAVDIAKSYVLAFSPPPERAAHAELSRDLGELMMNPGAALELLRESTDESEASGCLRAFLGVIPEATLHTDMGSVSFQNVQAKEQQLLEIETHLY